MNLYAVEAGNFKLDGGAMFGVVPKVLWERTNPSDKNNQIEMASRCLLIEDGDRLILIDTGMGNKQDAKFFSHYSLWGNFNLTRSLKEFGFHPDDITDVFLTHLHFDHCGGAITRSSSGLLVPAFKNATFWSHKNHWKWAIAPNAREKASFLTDNILPIAASGQLKLLEGDGPVLKDTPLCFDILIVDGHTEKQMLPLINYKGKSLLFAADLIPTVGHLPIPYIMGYDCRPLLTLEEKERILTMAHKNKWCLFLEHDPNHELIGLKVTPKGLRMDFNTTLNTYFT